MPTKQDIQNYLNKDTRLHTPLSASVHFGIDIGCVYKILKGEDCELF